MLVFLQGESDFSVILPGVGALFRLSSAGLVIWTECRDASSSKPIHNTVRVRKLKHWAEESVEDKTQLKHLALEQHRHFAKKVSG